MVLAVFSMLGEVWGAPRRPWDDGSRHGLEVRLVADFVSVLCVVFRGRNRRSGRKKTSRYH
jgi:hypothetical protein